MRSWFARKPPQTEGMEALRSLRQREHGTTTVGPFTVEYICPHVLYWEHKDIFEHRIYHFEAVRRAPVIIDAGACAGMSMLYFKSIYPDAKITSFEPDPEISAVLRRNVERNQLQDVTVVEAGLGREDGEATFFPDGSNGGTMTRGSSNVVDRLEAIVMRPAPITIRVARLSRWMNEPIDLLKMNIEGMEGEVFEEIEPKLELVREVVFEYHSFYNLPQSLGGILQVLDRRGFRYHVADATCSKASFPMSLPRNYRLFNLVYARRS